MQEEVVVLDIKDNRFSDCHDYVKQVFEDHWESYLFENLDKIRPVEKREVEKMLLCKDEGRGFYELYCDRCQCVYTVYYGCHSRICSKCGKVHTDKWAQNLASKVFRVYHRHITLTVPPLFWKLMRQFPLLKKVLMDSSIETLKITLSSKKHGNIIPGVIAVLHPFGRDIGFRPHVHCIVTEGGFNGKHEFVSIGNYIPYDLLHKVWRDKVIANFKKHLPVMYHRLLEDQKTLYSKGFHANVKKERIWSSKHLAKYIGRYIRHPAIANTRIVSYDGKQVTFFYEDENKKKHYMTVNVYEFISALIQHIPEEQFKMIRYYGAYSRKHKKKYKKYLRHQSIRQTTLLNFDGKRIPRCPICLEKMRIINFRKGKPPPFEKIGEKITDWHNKKLTRAM